MLNAHFVGYNSSGSLKIERGVAQSVNNDKFLIKRGLIFNISDDYKTGTLESRNHNALKLFKGTTVAYLENVMYHEPLLLINQIIETERPTEKNPNQEIKFDNNITVDQEKQIRDLIDEYKDVFANDLSEIGSTHVVEHKIQLTENTPIKSKPYKVSPKERQIIGDQIEEMLEQGIIRPSQSPYSSPIVLVKKKGDDKKM